MKEKTNNYFPDFSVLMSVYKNEKPEYLDQSLISLEKQTVVPTEIVLVEDGPISNELENIILKHKRAFGKRFKIVRSKQNHGLGASLKLGTKYITTNWIARMDSDDYSVPTRFEKQLNYIKENPNVAIIGGQVSEFSGSVKNIVGHRKVPISSELINTFLKWRSPFNHPTIVINKAALENVGGYIPFGNLEDYYLWSRMIVNHYTVENLPDTLTLMRVDQGMYARRGNVKNIKYFLKLRSYLRKNKLINRREEIIGDFLMSINIVIPGVIRKKIYTSVLHKC